MSALAWVLAVWAVLILGAAGLYLWLAIDTARWARRQLRDRGRE